jgi:flagellar hook-length control protein FliK
VPAPGDATAGVQQTSETAPAAPSAIESQTAAKTEAAVTTQAAPTVLPQGRTGPEPLPRFSPSDVPVPQNGPPVPESRPTPMHGVPMEIGFRSLEGQKRFDIRLDPGELGRVEVRLDIGDEGTVKATLTVDRPETLQLMQRESRALERALEQAGFRPSDGSIDLRLSDRAPDRGQGGERDGAPPRQARGDDAPDAEAIRTLHPALLARHVAAATGGVDLVI